MKLPAFLYGPYSEVKKEGRRLVTQLRRGVPWAELGGEMIDTRDVPGMLVLDGPSPVIFGEHFQLFVPARAIEKANHDQQLPDEIFVTLFEPAIATPWGFLTLLARVYGFHRPPENQRRYLHALVRYWDELDAEGARYCLPSGMPGRLWSLPTMIKYCLANQGLPVERCQAPLPPGGIRELVNQTRARLD